MAITPPSSIDHFNHSVLLKNKKDSHSEAPKHEVSEEQIMFEMIQQEESPAAEQWKHLHATDEMSAALTQFSNMKKLESKKKNGDSLFSNFDAILEEDVYEKAGKILNAAKNDNTGFQFLRNFTKQLFPDSSDLILILRELISNKEIEKKTKKKLEEILKEAEEHEEPKFYKAGINCALKAKLFGKKLNLQPKILRSAYRGFLYEDEESIDFYIKVISNFGAKNRSDVVDFFESLLLCDIGASDPSCSRIEFGFFLKKIAEIQKIKSFETNFVNEMTMNKISKKYIKDEVEWLLFIINLIKYPTAIESIMSDTIGKVSIQATRREMSFLLTAIHDSLKKVPETLFKDLKFYHEILTQLRCFIGKNYIRE